MLLRHIFQDLHHLVAFGLDFLPMELFNHLVSRLRSRLQLQNFERWRC